ncbi:MAG: hypothetical protein AB7G47_19510 [Mycolicibacterium sp.]|uniref:hypothetical protein n=1 Tax=Mycolicibacterium sp. TaxID=2320850 RepID=UPI003D0A28F3
MNARIECSPPVKALIGGEVLTTLRRTADHYSCYSCHQPGNATRARTNVIVITGTDGPPVIQLAHAGCTPSQIVTLDGPTTDKHSFSRGEDVISMTTLWPAPEGPLAGLIIDRHAELSIVFGHGDREDPWLQLLLDKQWALVLDANQDFPLVSTTALELDGPGRVTIDAPDAQSTVTLLAPLPDPTPEWITAAATRGIVRVYAGDIGLRNHPEHDAPNAVVAAIAAGQVAGAYIPVTATT